MEQATEKKKSSRNVIWGVLCLIVPFFLLIFTLSGYAIVTFVASQLASGPSISLKILGMVLGLVGILSVVGILVGIPLGIILLVKKDK
ncbi:MAG: hypothetical protein UT02_C0049G0003 [Parcubacteria group bacterium GW2011_GWC2_38_7]|nr:MAG: hypothetical protein UT02_C0049G0003 [Parcubacteria group bacterium GW2011_GWC2_38_7]